MPRPKRHAAGPEIAACFGWSQEGLPFIDKDVMRICATIIADYDGDNGDNYGSAI